jgi:hypothetical protein
MPRRGIFERRVYRLPAGYDCISLPTQSLRLRGVDAKQRMKKPAAKPKEKKTLGTLAVEKYRPKMNKLTDAERERLLAQAMVTIYGQPANADDRTNYRDTAGNR